MALCRQAWRWRRSGEFYIAGEDRCPERRAGSVAGALAPLHPQDPADPGRPLQDAFHLHVLGSRAQWIHAW